MRHYRSTLTHTHTNYNNIHGNTVNGAVGILIAKDGAHVLIYNRYIFLFLYVACSYGFPTCFKVRECMLLCGCCSAYRYIENIAYGFCDFKYRAVSAIQQRSLALSIQHINPKGNRKCAEKVKKTIRNIPRFFSGLLHMRCGEAFGGWYDVLQDGSVIIINRHTRLYTLCIYRSHLFYDKYGLILVEHFIVIGG